MKNRLNNRREILYVAAIGGLLFPAVSLFAENPPSMKGNLEVAGQIVGGIDPNGDIDQSQALAEKGFNKLTDMTAPNGDSSLVVGDEAAKHELAQAAVKLRQEREEFMGAKTGEFVAGHDSVKTIETGHLGRDGSSANTAFGRGYELVEHGATHLLDSDNVAVQVIGAFLYLVLFCPAVAVGTINGIFSHNN